MTRILHVTEALGGGIQSAIVNYVRATPDLHHTVFSRGRYGQSTHDWPPGVDEQRYQGGLTGFYRALHRHVRDTRPDVMHLHSSFAGAARAFLPRRTPIVYSPHCFAFERSDVAPPLRWGFTSLEFLLSRRRQTTLSVSPYEAMLSRTLNSSNPVVVAFNPSPMSAGFAGGGEPRHPEDDPGDQNTVTMVGRLGSQKDPELFAEVAVLCRDDDLHFSWIGDGQDGAPEMLRSAGVAVSGWRSPDEVKEMLGDSMLYLHTAAWEGGPVSAIEAASLGVPVISRSIPSMRSLGYATGGETAHELADAVRRFQGDAEFRSRVALRTDGVRRRSSSQQLERGLREAYGLALDS